LELSDLTPPLPKKTNRLPREFWIVTFIAFVNAICFTIIIPLLYPYAKEFNLSDFQASLLTTSFAICQFVGTPILGKLSDRYGRKPLLVLSLAGTVVANIIASFTPFAWLLFLARMFDGLTGGNVSIARAVISDVTTAEERPQAFGIFGATFRLGFVVGPTLSYFSQKLPTFAGISSLGMSFLVAATIAVVVTLLTLFFLPETLPASQRDSFDLNPRDFALDKIFRALTYPKIGQLLILTFLSGSTFTIFTFAFQPFLLFVLDREADTLAMVFVLVGILGFVTQVLALEPLRKRFDLVEILSVTIALRGVAFLLIPLFPNITAFFVIMAAFGVVNSFPLPITNALISLNTSDRQQGEILGINASYLSISNAVGPPVSGLLVSFGYGTPFWVTGILTLLTAVFAYRLKWQLASE